MRSLDYYIGAGAMCLTLALVIVFIGHDVGALVALSVGLGFGLGSAAVTLANGPVKRWWNGR